MDESHRQQQLLIRARKERQERGVWVVPFSRALCENISLCGREKWLSTGARGRPLEEVTFRLSPEG